MSYSPAIGVSQQINVFQDHDKMTSLHRNHLQNSILFHISLIEALMISVRVMYLVELIHHPLSTV